MGFFSWLFGKEKKNIQSVQPDGFCIVKHTFGETQARALFQRADDGDVVAQITLAECFRDWPDAASYAMSWYEKAAELGSSEAFHQLTYYYEGRRLGGEADLVKAEVYRNKALELKNSNAFYKLGSQYYTGDGVEENHKKAFEYYMKAANLGNSRAMAEVGLCYLNGDGIEKNGTQAFAWLYRSNDSDGHYHLAQCYLKGIGIPKNEEKAVEYLEKAIDEKCTDLSRAREQLADLYRKGYGGEAFEKKVQLAQNSKRYDDLLSRLADLMDSEQN